MKIRDLRQYIADRCGIEEPDLSLLGDTEEPFLVNLWGEEKSVESLIEESASFAQHSEEQLFYEFVQNAFDANATDLFFYVNKDYLIVLNNGDPFYTDRKVKGVAARNGQLYNFLAKNKSDKYNKKDQLGNYGQGSKLLYTLLIDDSAGHNSDALIKAIKEEKKGPYLISWADTSQLQNFLLDRYEWDYESPYDDWDNLLVAKILLSYYPIMPGIDESLFSERDYHNIVQAFNQLVDPKRNVNKLQQGTALIIPLGKGQYEKIYSKQNREKVLARLGTFASIQKDKVQNVTKKLQRIYVFGNESNLHQVASIFHHTKIKNEDFDFHFAFHPVFAQDNCVNFFKALPILETKYHLGFIVDSQDFETDPSRQRLLFLSKVADQMSLVFPEILNKILGIKKDSPDVFYTLYSSLLSSRILVDDNEDIAELRTQFETVFKPFLMNNILAISGNYVTFEKARCSKTYTIIDLKELGISAFEWINKEVGELYENNIGINIRKGTIKEVLQMADAEKLKKWIKKIRPEVYQKFQNACYHEFWLTDVFSDVKLYRSNKGNLFSKKEILSSSSKIFFYNDVLKKDVFEAWDDIEFIEQPIPIHASSYLPILFEKVKHNQQFFSSCDAGKEIACTIMSYLLNSEPSRVSEVKKISILRNRLGQQTPFEELFDERPSGTVLYDNYLVKGYKPKSLPKQCYVSTNSLWNWVEKHFSQIVTFNDWAEYGQDYIKDIISAYNNYKNQNTPLNAPVSGLNLYLDDNGVPTPNVQFRLKSDCRLTEEEYNLISPVFPNNCLCRYSNLKLLTTLPFQLPTIELNDVLDFSHTYSVELVKIFFKVNNNLLDKWVVSKERNGFRFKKKEDYQKNYISGELDSSVRNCLRTGHYIEIPDEIVSFIPLAKSSSYNPYQADFLEEALNKCSQKEYLLPLVEKSDERIKRLYLSLVSLAFDSQVVNEDDIRWKILDFGIQNAGFRSLIFSKISFNNSSLPSTIKKSELRYHGHNYDVYKLNNDIALANANIEVFLNLLPDKKAFKDAYYAGNQEEVTPQYLYTALNKQSLSVVQLQFCMDYSIENNMSSNTLCLASDNDLSKALDLIYQEKYSQFDKYFKIKGFDKSCQVFADPRLLLPSEKLPSGLYDWLTKTEGATGFLDSLLTSSHTLIQVRQAIYDDVQHKIISKDYSGNSLLLRNTIQWIRSLNREYMYGQPCFMTIMDIVNTLDDNFPGLPMYAYTGKVVNKNKESDELVPSFVLKDPSYDSYYIRLDKCSQIHAQLIKSTSFKQLMNGSTSYFLTPSIDFLTRHRLNKRHLIKSEKAANDSSSYVEWDDPIYNEWKNKTQYSIYLSPKKISSYFKVSTLDETLYTEARDESDMGYQYKKKVIIKYPITKGKSVLKHLEQAVSDADLDWFVQSFVLLQGMFLDKLDQLQDIAKKQGTTVETVISSAANSTKKSISGNGNITVPEEKKDSIQKIADSFEPDVLEVLSKNTDLVLDALESVLNKEPEAKIRQIIGYIGEQIYELYLKDKLGIKYKNVADMGVGEYDFENIDDNSFIDVKTNIYSLKDGNAPFYIHKSQNMFMKSHKDADFRIVRISLADLNLVDEYRRLRNIYGADEDPRTNESLKSECRSIASKYWKKAKVETFVSSSPEYSIKIEQS